MKLAWANDSEISFCIEDGQAILSANPDGLISLAAHFSALAAKESGSYIHYDDQVAFKEGSDALVVEKLDR